jgi:hypothetical protein
MNRASAVFLLCIAACGLALAATAPTTQQQQQEQPPQQSRRSSSSSRERYSDRYSILTQRNIFLKDRSRGSRNGSSNGNGSTTQSSTQPAHRSPEETLLLRGIVMEQGEVRAYFEDIANSRMVRVAMGEPIARGRITSIGLDAVEYETPAAGGVAAHRTFVAVGNDLTGKVSEYDMPSSSAAAAAMATTSPVMPSGVEGLNPNDPNLTQEQRMKLKRMQELKK